MLVGLDLRPSGCLVLTESLHPWIASTALVTRPAMSYSVPFGYVCPTGSVLTTFIQSNDTCQLECSKFMAADRTDSCTSIPFDGLVVCPPNRTLAGIALSESYNGTNGTVICCRLLGIFCLIPQSLLRRLWTTTITSYPAHQHFHSAERLSTTGPKFW